MYDANETNRQPLTATIKIDPKASHRFLQQPSKNLLYKESPYGSYLSSPCTRVNLSGEKTVCAIATALCGVANL